MGTKPEASIVNREEIISEIYINSTNLRERIDSEHLTYKSKKYNKKAAKRIDRWKQLLGVETNEEFKKRLLWGGLPKIDNLPLSEPEVYKGLKAVKWLNTLTEIIDLAPRIFQLKEVSEGIQSESSKTKLSEEDEEFLFLKDSRIPYQEIYVPAVLVATDRLKEKLKKLNIEISNPTLIGIQKALLKQLVPYGERVLHRNFLLEKSLTNEEEIEHPLYHLFLNRMLNKNGLLILFKEFPVLARITAILVDQWIDDQIRFICDYEKDKDEIAEYFFNSIETGPIISIIDGISDPHNGRRFVKILKFEGSRGIVYKPRDIKLNEAMNKFLGSIKECNKLITLRPLKCISKKGYGWVELVEHLPCKHKEDAANYFRKAGQLLGLMYVLRGTDCHKENLIASEDNPMIVDIETLMNPIILDSTKDVTPTDFTDIDSLIYDESLLNIGLLPDLDIFEGKKDISALGAVLEQDIEEERDYWMDINTENMRKEKKKIVSKPVQNNAYWGEITFSPSDYVPEVCDGFSTIINTLKNKAEITWAKWLEPFNNCTTRIIFRTTSTYAKIIRHLSKPEYLRDGLDQSLELEVLYRSLISNKSKPKHWDLIATEIRQLENYDFPIFLSSVNSDMFVLTDERQTLPMKSGFASVARRIKGLTDQNLKLQLENIQTSFHLWALRNSTYQAKEVGSSGLYQEESLDKDKMMQESSRICAELSRRSLGNELLGKSWLGLTVIPNTSTTQIGPIGVDMYSGNSGLGLLFAAQARVSLINGRNDLALYKLSEEAFLPVVNHVTTISKSIDKSIKYNIGGISGLGSIIYSLTVAGVMLDNDEWIDVAVVASNLLSRELIAQDTNIDVMSGCSGTLLALIALHKVRPSKEIADLCEACGDNLAKKMEEVSPNIYAWKGPEGIAHTGFSHGASGICLALLRLYALCKKEQYYNMAINGIKYENSQFSTQINNWNDMRPGINAAMNSWCNGATGIGLARIACSKICSNNIFTSDIERAIEITLNDEGPTLHQMCCGVMGQVELLLSAADEFTENGYRAEAFRRASSIIRDSEKNKGYMLLSNFPRNLFSPSLFQGQAGIAYQLMRLNHQKQIPSVMTFELPDCN